MRFAVAIRLTERATIEVEAHDSAEARRKARKLDGTITTRTVEKVTLPEGGAMPEYGYRPDLPYDQPPRPEGER